MYKNIGNYSMISYFSKCYSKGIYGNFMDYQWSKIYG